MRKIVYLPLDDRPCNAAFPVLLFGDALRIVTPPELGYYKTPTSWEKLKAFLDQELTDADGLVLSLDQLLYGGLIPSRLHHLKDEIISQRIAYVREIKNQNPQIVLYAYQCIMRCPSYSSAQEEPDYYADYGRDIFHLGEAKHRFRLGLCTLEEMEQIAAKVPEKVLEDYVSRRAFNLNYNLAALELVQEQVIDALMIPQDDSAKYGFTAMDQEKIRTRVSEMRIGAKVLMYPGADELGLTVMSRMLLHFEKIRPRVYVKMASESAAQRIPPYEDRPLGETVKYQLVASGCRLCTSLHESDIVLGVTFPDCPGADIDAVSNPPMGYMVDRNLAEFNLFLQDAIEDGKIVTIADNAYANAGDPELISLLDQMNLLRRIHGYAGWNTSSNTIGTAIAEGVHALIRGTTQQHFNFLGLRYLEDAGYMGCVRQETVAEDLTQTEYDYGHTDGIRGWVSSQVEKRLLSYLRRAMPSIEGHLEITDVYMPWARMFEVGLSVVWHQ